MALHVDERAAVLDAGGGDLRSLRECLGRAEDLLAGLDARPGAFEFVRKKVPAAGS